MVKSKTKRLFCILLCILMLIPQSGIACAAESGKVSQSDTGEFEIHEGEV